MLSRSLAFGFVLLASTGTVAAEADSWGYKTGQMRIEQQANFCNTEAAIDELADIFQRFGPQTGFSALASSPVCGLKVHSFTPVALKKAIKIKLKSGEFYTINTIRVKLKDGPMSYLITTRQYQEAN